MESLIQAHRSRKGKKLLWGLLRNKPYPIFFSFPWRLRRSRIVRFPSKDKKIKGVKNHYENSSCCFILWTLFIWHYMILRFIAFRRRVVAQWKSQVNGKKFLLRLFIATDANVTIFVLFVDFRVTDNKNKIFLSFLGATPFLPKGENNRRYIQMKRKILD